MHRRRFIMLGSLVALGLSAAPWTGAAAEQTIIRIGMPAAMFREVKPAMFAALTKPFYALVQSQTGLQSELVLIPSPDDMRQQLDTGKLQFGVFHGFEFAWMKQKLPTLKPIMIAAPTHKPLQAFLVIRADADAKTMADLKGKTLALPGGTKEHSRIFVDRKAYAAGDLPSKFFGSITNPVNAETGLHEVFDKKAQVAVVDGCALQCFGDRYPGRAKQLKTLVESEKFPLSVVAIRDGVMDPQTLKRFTDGMSQANTNPMGRNLMQLMQMTGFEPVPPDYDNQLGEIMKAYPAPGDAPK